MPFDLAASREAVRIRDERICRFCRSEMRRLALRDGYNRLFLCEVCGYFGGDGMRHQLVAHLSRGVVAQVQRMSLSDDAVPLRDLYSHLNAVPERLLDLAPSRAEEVVMDLPAQALGCEVLAIGGVRDGGVDGYVMRGDDVSAIVQVKWHRQSRRAESVSLVREIAGTLLARGVPRGVLVTTSERVSKEAAAEIRALTEREIVGLGRLELSVKTYQDILGMLEIAAARPRSIDTYIELLEGAAFASGFDTVTGEVTEWSPA